MWGALLQGATALGGAYLSTRGNTRAAQQENEARTQGATTTANGITQGADTYATAVGQGADQQIDANNNANYLNAQYTRQGADQEAGGLTQGAATTAAGITQGATTQAAGLENSRGEINSGYENSNRTLNEIRGQGQVGTEYLRKTVGESGNLTAAQQAQLDEQRRSVNSSIRGGSMAGSGRLAAGLFKKAESDFTNTALDQNRARSMSAAGQLNQQGTVAGMQVSNNAVNQGNANAGITQRVGEVTGAGQTRSAAVTGAGQAGSAAIRGQAERTAGHEYAQGMTRAGDIRGNATTQQGQIRGNATTRAGEVMGNMQTQNGRTTAGATSSNANIWGQTVGSIGASTNNATGGSGGDLSRLASIWT